MILQKKDSEVLGMQDKNIRDCQNDRTEWSQNAAHIDLAIKGIIFPEHNKVKNTYRNTKGSQTLVTLIERQYRNMMNFISGNKPSISIRKNQDMSRADVQKAEMLVRRDFIESDFYLNDMDNIIQYGFKRGIVYVLSLMNEDAVVETKVTDPMDCYVDTRAHKKSEIQHIIYTFTKTMEEVKYKYTLDRDGKHIDWSKHQEEIAKSLNVDKNNLITEPSTKDIVLFREGWYLDTIQTEGGEEKRILVKVLSTKYIVLAITEYPAYDFLPLDYFAPINEDGEIHIRSWFKNMLVLERIANEVMGKFVHINKIGGRQVFVREGTRITKGSNKTLNSMGIEVIQIGESQELPEMVELLKISQADMAFLNLILRQAEEAGGIRQDAMGEASLGSEASGTAIAQLKAGSYANVGSTVNELNKFMKRLGKTYFKLYEQGGGAEIKYFSDETDSEVKIDTKKLGIPMMHIEPKSSFDDAAEKLDAIEMMKQILTTNPDAKISPEIWGEVYGQKNDLAKRILIDMNTQKDPHLLAAQAHIQLLLSGAQPAVSKSDDHIIHMAAVSKVIQTADNLPPEINKNLVTYYNAHKAFSGGDPSKEKKALPKK